MISVIGINLWGFYQKKYNETSVLNFRKYGENKESHTMQSNWKNIHNYRISIVLRWIWSSICQRKSSEARRNSAESRLFDFIYAHSEYIFILLSYKSSCNHLLLTISLCFELIFTFVIFGFVFFEVRNVQISIDQYSWGIFVAHISYHLRLLLSGSPIWMVLFMASQRSTSINCDDFKTNLCEWRAFTSRNRICCWLNAWFDPFISARIGWKKTRRENSFQTVASSLKSFWNWLRKALKFWNMKQ